MDYSILEARVEFSNNVIEKVTVLVDCTSSVSHPLSDVRAYYGTKRIMNGYMHISQKDQLSMDLLQRVATAGSQDDNPDRTFPGWRKRVMEIKF